MMVQNNLQYTQALSVLLEGLSTDLNIPDIKVSGMTLDSRMVRSGELFFALEGLNVSGVKFIREALAKGAAAILTASTIDELTRHEADSRKVPIIHVPDLPNKLPILAARFYSDPSKQFKLIGITGTDGKTSVCHFIAQALKSMGRECGVLGTLGNGFYDRLSTATHTTSDILTLNKCLSGFAEHTDYVSMEVSSHGIDQGRIGGLSFETAVLTNLSRDHLDYHGSIDVYKAVKQRLFAMPGLKNVVLNLDDDFGCELLATANQGLKIYAYGFNEESVTKVQKWVLGQNLRLNQNGFRFDIRTAEHKACVEISLLGRFNASNVLAVFAALLSVGIAFEEAVKAVQCLQGVDGRMELHQSQSMPKVVIDYAHTPQALKSVLTVLREHFHGALYCVFGCGGDRDKGKRPLMAKVAAELSDFLLITDDNPRSEPAETIVEDIVSGLQDFQHYMIEHDRKKAIVKAIELAGENDVVLVAGKGHEDYQIIGKQKFFFSDKMVVAETLKEEPE